ncbi:gliding motility regulatory protein [Abditibacteriota bacterium]|nr:gliding motility regulatory protein [Abditibacteriota bacterium]
MIHDIEMRALFSAESEEHLQHLDEGLLRLETAPGDHATLEEVFRHAHSLKGAARMLGLSDVEALAHGFEDALGAAAKGRKSLSSERVELLLGGLDAMRALVRQATTGQTANVDVAFTLAAMHAEIPPPSVPAPSTASDTVVPPSSLESFPVAVDQERGIEVARGEALAVSSQGMVPVPPPLASNIPDGGNGSGWSIETMRVEPGKLDALLAMAGELVVSTTRAVRGKSELQALVELREEWGRAASASRRTLREVVADGGSNPRAIRELERMVEREAERLDTLGQLLEKFSSSSNDLSRLGSVVTEMEAAIRGVRLLPLSTVFGVFPRAVRDLSRSSGKPVRLLVEGGETHADKRILEALKDPLMHLIRNSIDHGLESPAERAAMGKNTTATLRLRGHQTAHQVIIEVEDDGRGLDAEAIRRSALRKGLKSEGELATLSIRDVYELIFASGFSTRSQVSELSGRGVGLDIVRANVQQLRGTVEVDSRPGQGCLFRLTLPVTLATTRVLLVQASEQTYAVPVESVRGIYLVKPRDIYRFQGRETVSWNSRPTSVARLNELLHLPATDASDEKPCLVLESGDECVGILVDELLEEQEIILKSLGALVDRVRHLAGATILETGEVCLVLNTGELIRTATRQESAAPMVLPLAPSRAKSVLLVEDSITTRTQEKRILESAGYEVTTAVDGVDGWSKLTERDFDAVVTDVEMPRMDGLALSVRIREDSKYSEMPIILVTSLSSDEDRRRGVEVGANAYIVKSAFDQRDLLDVLGRLA